MRPSEAMMKGISAFILSVSAGVITIQQEFTAGLADLMDLLGAVRDLFTAILTEPIGIIEVTAEFSGLSLTQGDWAFFGPFTFAVGLASVGVAFWAWFYIDAPIPLPGVLGRVVNRFRGN